MNPAKFDEHNITYVLEGCKDLPARLSEYEDGTPFVETRWLPTDAERKALIDGGAVMLRILGKRPQPCYVGVVHDNKLVED